MIFVVCVINSIIIHAVYVCVALLYYYTCSMFVLHCSIIIHAVCLCCIALLLYMQYVCVAFNNKYCSTYIIMNDTLKNGIMIQENHHYHIHHY